MPEGLISTGELDRAASRLRQRPEGNPVTSRQNPPYSLRRVTLDQADPAFIAEWQALHDILSPDMPMTDPEWLKGYFGSQKSALSVYALYQGDRLGGIAPFIRRDFPMKWHLGEFALATLPLTRLLLPGGSPDLPADQVAYDLLFAELARNRNVDTLYFEGVLLDSFLWKYLHESEFVRENFQLYQPDRPSPRLFLHLEGMFQQYLGKFSSKSRKNLVRTVKRLREGILGEMRFVRMESVDEVENFLEHAVKVSRKTYQWTLHQRGLAATDLIRERLLHDAEHGWMRCYLLFCDDRPVAFLLGSQYNGRFLLNELGFDPAFAKYSVGTALQFLTIEDLFIYKRPVVLDFQDYGTYKEVWATDSCLQGKIFLFRRSGYSTVCRIGHYVCQATNRTLSSLLDRWNLKARLKKRMRGLEGTPE